MGRFCSQCGNEVADDDRFCPNCGVAVQLSQQESANLNKQQNVQVNYNSQPPPGVGYNLDPTFQEMFFKTHGRLNRLRYIKRTLLLSLIEVLSFIVLCTILDIDSESKTADTLLTCISLLTVYPYYCLLVRRIEDLDRNRSEVIPLTIVIVVLAFVNVYDVYYYLTTYSAVKGAYCAYGLIMLYIAFKDGTHGPNQYGEDPLHRYPQNQ